jgi:DNA-binding response OmpR family regulator
MPSSAVARRLRREQNRTSTLMLAARDAIPDVVTGLDLGIESLSVTSLRFCNKFSL